VNNIKPIYDNEVDMQPKPQSSGLGVAIGLLICGALIMGFPRLMQIDGWLLWVFSCVGFLVLLVGVMGACNEIGRK
jgi:hypothetical protein